VSAAATSRRWVVMRSAGREYAIDAVSVREIHDGWQAQPLTGTADWFLGTLVVRGRVVPVTSFDAWLDARSGRRVPPYGVEITVGEDAYLLAVSDVRHAVETPPDPMAASTGSAGLAASGALAARGVRVERRSIGGNDIDTFTPAALIAAPAFSDITAHR